MKSKYGVDRGTRVWRLANSVFDYLPFAATIDDVIFCVHGGILRPLSPTETALETINNILCLTSVKSVKGDRKSVIVSVYDMNDDV